MNVTVKVLINYDTIQGALEEVAENIGSVDGIGADGTSSYEITESVVNQDGDVFTITFNVERTEGKFASKDDIGAALEEALGREEITLPIEIL